LVLMDLAYLHARHLKWEDKMPGHLVTATARSSDDDAPAPAPSPASAPAASAVELNFMKWDLTDINSVPWDQLSFSLTGSKTMKHADVPQYLFPALCLASEMMMRHATEPKAMIDFFEECKAQIESDFGESTEGFRSITCAEPPVEWRRPLRNEDYTAEEAEYIKSIWAMAAKTFQSAEGGTFQSAEGGSQEISNVEGGSQEISTVEGGSQDITTVSRDLRSRDDPKTAKGPGGAAQPLPGRPGREKQKASVRTLPVVGRGEPRIVSSDRGRSRGRGRKRGRSGLIESSARLEVPLSPSTGRMLLGQVRLNFR
jgi:hypothetical protein